MNSKLRCLFISLTLLIVPFVSYAQDSRSYFISSFDADISIKKDSTVDIIEKINYQFSGTYNKGWRAISTKDIGAITDISVVDATTGRRLEYSSSPLEKTDPDNWGKYAITKTEGYVNVEWYYNESNSQHAWQIHYTVHGLVGFYKTFDEIYWNLFTEYEVPVSSVSARVNFAGIPNPKTDELAWYRTNSNGTGYFVSTEDGYVFSDTDISPYEDVTIAIGFPKGIVEQSEYWKDFFSINFGFVIAFILILGSILTSIILWFKHEHFPKHDRSIVTQYEPPKYLKPAQMDIIYRERLSKKAWSATIIDLAVKGFLRIEEDVKNYGMIPEFLVNILSKLSVGKDYNIHLLKSAYRDDESLDTYEKNFLGTLFFFGGTVFSTREMRKDRIKSMELYKDMLETEHEILEEMGSDYPEIYSNPVQMKNGRKNILFISFLVICVAFGISYHQFGAILFGILVSGFIYMYFIKYNPRLSLVGNDTWRDIEGFKNYLYKAERYRLQNLTPDTFEKFLPYAMIFGIEKQWSKPFDSIQMKSPDWYSGSFSSGLVASGTSIGGFSASGFSKSFTTSFSTAFSSAGASGSSGSGSGGGGSSGGGGGGGGGGAS